MNMLTSLHTRQRANGYATLGMQSIQMKAPRCAAPMALKRHRPGPGLDTYMQPVWERNHGDETMQPNRYVEHELLTYEDTKKARQKWQEAHPRFCLGDCPSKNTQTYNSEAEGILGMNSTA